MAKLILLILAGLAVYLIVKNFRRRVEREGDGTRRTEESMVRCAVCGVHHPRGESLLAAGKFYCSPEHERQSRDGG